MDTNANIPERDKSVVSDHVVTAVNEGSPKETTPYDINSKDAFAVLKLAKGIKINVIIKAATINKNID